MEEQIQILPYAKTLKKITTNLDKSTGLDDAGYLKIRLSKLNVLLVIDKIYLSKCVEASGFQVFGLTEGCDIAATALCFMIQFLSSGYKDMIDMYPVRIWEQKNKNLALIKLWPSFIKLDSMSLEFKFFKEYLCEGTLKELKVNCFTGGQIF